MPSCTVCVHPERAEIDQTLVSRSASYRDIARRYGVSKDAVGRHVHEHLPALLTLAQDAERASRADTLLDRLEALQDEAAAVLEEVKGTEHYGPRLAAIREMRHNLKIIGEVTKELNRTPTLNIYLTPEWIELRTVIVEALEPYPDATQSVLTAIGGRDSG